MTHVEQPASFVHPLAMVRHSRGWSYQGLVDAIARQASRMPHVGNMAARREKAWRWEHWGVVPDRDTQLALAALLDVPERHVDRYGWPRWLPTGDSIAIEFPWSGAGSQTALGDALERAMLDRRGFLVLSGGALTALADQWVTVPHEKVAAASDGRSRVDAEVVHWIEGRIPMLRRMDDQLGGEQLRHVVDAELRLVGSLLNNSTYSSAIGTRLYAASAELGQLAGWVSFDAGLHGAAQRYYVAALHAAQSAGDRQLGANVLACMSFQSVIAGEPRDGIMLADRAMSGAAGKASPRVRAMVASRSARAHAKAGDTTACRASLNQAQELLDRADADQSDPAWIYYFDQAELAAQAGACWLDLRQAKDAQRELNEALRLQKPTYVRDRTIYHIRLASTQVRMNEIDQACVLALDALDLARRSPSSRSMNEIKQFRVQLEPWRREPRVQDFDQALDTFAA